MFENSNKEVIREIARESMKSHRLRNLRNQGRAGKI